MASYNCKKCQGRGCPTNNCNTLCDSCNGDREKQTSQLLFYKKQKVVLQECYNCESNKQLKYSVGAFGGYVSLFCSQCGCEGGSSRTSINYSGNDKKTIRRLWKIASRQAKINWHLGFLEKTSWSDYLHYPPEHVSELISSSNKKLYEKDFTKKQSVLH